MSGIVTIRDSAEGVRLIQLQRPGRRNAMVPELLLAAIEAFRAAATARVRAIVLSAADPAFCVGADLKWAGSLDDPAEGIACLVSLHHELVRVMRAVPAPVVAAVNGAAAGGGWSLALAADYRVASVRASFTAAYFRLSLPPDGGNSVFLSRILGPARAMELLLTNRRLSAEEALALGLVSEVVAHEHLEARAFEAASQFATVAPETMLAARQLLDAAGSTALADQLDAEERAMCEAAQREQFLRGLQEFLSR